MQEPVASKNSQRFVELFLEIERRVDVNAIAIDGVELWPLIRARLRKPFKETGETAPEPADRPVRSAAAVPAAAAIAQTPWWRRLFGASAAPPPRREKRPAKPSRAEVEAAVEAAVSAQMRRFEALPRPDYVVMSRPNKYYQKLQGKRYAPILDPVFEDLARRGPALVLCEGQGLDFECVHPPQPFDTSPVLELRRFVPTQEYTEVIAQMEALRAVVAEIEPAFEFDPRKVLFRYVSHRLRRQFYLRLFKALAPRVVFFSSLTSWVPVIWACRDLHIPTVDIQHGGQSSHHGFNTHYGCVPRDGYHLLPDFFWCWGHQNRDIVGRWFPGGANRHIPLVGGNRWKAKWIGEAGLGMLGAEQRRYLEELRDRRPCVLVTLSHGVDELLPECLLGAMQCRPQWYWLVRMHPINRGEDLSRRLRERLRQRGIENYEMRLATDVPLHALLQHVQHHLTPFSTAAREAVDFGVPTTIIDPIGKVDFADDIEAGTFSYADTPGEICAQIEAALAEGQHRTGESLLETDEAYVDGLLAVIEHWRAGGASEAVR